MISVVKPLPEVQAKSTPEEIRTPVVLTPTRVEEMLRARRVYQAVKFRTTCSDCVPNL